MDENRPQTNAPNERLNALLDLYPAPAASAGLKSRIRAIGDLPQAPPVIIVWNIRRLSAFAALFLFMIMSGAWVGNGPYGLVARSQQMIDAALVNAVFGPTTNLGDVL